MTRSEQPHGPRDLAYALLPVLRDNAAEIDRDARFPREAMRILRGNGLLGLLVPTEYGGLGGDLTDLVECAQVLASGCLSTALIWAMHCQQVDVLVQFADPPLRADLLSRIARGEVYLGSVTTEPGKGGHLLTGVAPLDAGDDQINLKREAPVVTGGEEADGFLVTMRASPDARENEVTLVYADRTQLSIDVQDGWRTLGMRGTRSIGLRLAGAIPPAQVIGGSGEFRTVAIQSMVPAGHLAWAACWLGAARGALADMVALVRSANRPRGLDVGSDLAAERLARVRIDLEIVSSCLHRVREEVLRLRGAGTSLDNTATQIHLNTLKVVAAEHTFSAVNRLVQLGGMGVGYRQRADVPLERHFRDLRSASLNYADDRLLVAIGKLVVLDRGVRLA